MPDFSIKPKITTKVKDIAETNISRLNAAYNNYLGRPFVGETNIFDILNEAENRRESNSFGYSEQKAIGQKARLIYSGEGLKRYSLTVTLHYSFCRPDYIIEQLKTVSAGGEAFSYYQGQKYIGEYVISNFEVNTIDEFNNVTLCAELSLELTEAPQDEEDEEYEQQTKQTVNLPTSKIKSVTQNVPKTPVEVLQVSTGTVFDKLTDKAINMALRNAESYINSAIGV